MVNKINISFTSIKGRRVSNEDEHTIITNINNANENMNNINIFGIYDGHGGNEISKYVAEELPLHYCTKGKTCPFKKKYHESVFNHLQEKILKKKEGQSDGTTCLLNIMYKYQDEIHFNTVNLGDSRLVVVYKSGHTKQITTDHKPDEIIEKRRIEKIGGEIYKDSEGVFRVGQLSLARAFGDGDNAPYISRSGFKAFLIDTLEITNSSAEVYIKPSRKGRVICELLKAGMIQNFEHGWVVTEPAWASVMMLGVETEQ